MDSLTLYQGRSPPSIHSLCQQTGGQWYESVLGIELVVELAHPPRQLFLLHLVVAGLDRVCSIIKAFDQDLLGEEP